MSLRASALLLPAGVAGLQRGSGGSHGGGGAYRHICGLKFLVRVFGRRGVGVGVSVSVSVSGGGSPASGAGVGVKA